MEGDMAEMVETAANFFFVIPENLPWRTNINL